MTAQCVDRAGDLLVSIPRPRSRTRPARRAFWLWCGLLLCSGPPALD